MPDDPNEPTITEADLSPEVPAPPPSAEPTPEVPPPPPAPPSDEELLATFRAKQITYNAAKASADSADANKAQVIKDEDAAVAAAIVHRDTAVTAATDDATAKHAIADQAKADMDAAAEALITDLKAQE